MEFSPWNSPGQNTGVGSRSLLQGFFPTQGSNPGLLHCRQVLYQLSYQGSPGGREWGLIKWFLVRSPHLLNPHLMETLAGVGDAVMRKPNPVSAPRVQRWEQISKQANKIRYTQWVTRAMEKTKQEMRLERDGCVGPTVVPQEGRAGKVMLTKALQPPAHDSPAQRFSTRGYSTLQVTFCNV